MGRGVLAMLLASMVLPLPALAKEAVQVASASDNQPRLDLSGPWRFAIARDEAAAKALEDFAHPGFDPARFDTIPVPSNWSLLGYEPAHYKPFKPGETAGEGFYLKTFSLPAGWQGQRILLHFDGVWSSAEVWLNGRAMGRHDSGYTPYVLDVSDALKPGENVLAVRVRQIQHDYLFDTNDDWTLPGIYRPVWLEQTPPSRWIDRVETQTHFDSTYRDADLSVRIMVGDRHKQIAPGNVPNQGTQPYTLRVTLSDAQGRRVGGQEITVPSHFGTGRETALTLHLDHPLAWNAETPNLYRLNVEMLEGTQVSHNRSLKVGLREISTAGGVFRINGQAVKLRGVNRHDEYPDTGRATTREQWLQDIQGMKAANINYIRAAHYPPAEGFLDLCDELGMYVSDEVPMGEGGNHLEDPGFTGATMLRSYETVARDINHPAVVIWSIGNEDPLTSLHMAAIRTVKALDPTRPVLMPWRAEDWLPPEIDIIAPHYLTGAQMEQLAGRVSRPVLATEFSHAYGNDGFGDHGTRWKALTRQPNGVGGAVWMWADQGLSVRERKPDGTMGTAFKLIPDGFDGITDAYRRPTRDYWETKAVYAPVFPTVEAMAFTPGQAGVKIPIRNEYDFADLNTVSIGWALMEDDRQLASGETHVSGQPHAEALLDVPLDKLARVLPGKTYILQLSFRRPDGSEITARSVELTYAGAEAAASPSTAVSVERGEGVTVRAGQASYAFDPRSGLLISASLGGKAVLGAMVPAVWRQLNSTELLLNKPPSAAGWPDLQRYTAQVKDWRVEEQPDGVLLRATVDYRVNERNSFQIDYTYRISGDGVLHVDYTVRPKVEAPYLPFVGMRATMAAPLAKLHWLGLGPLDNWPNESAAAQLGVWTQGPPEGEAPGMKQARWADLLGSDGTGPRVEHAGYISLDPRAPGTVAILSDVRERPSKWPPEGPGSLLRTNGEPLVGGFTVDLAGGR